MKNYFSTPDITLASTILHFGIKLEALDPENPNRIQFCFERTKELDELVQLFWRGELKVEPLQFSAAQKILKSRINNETRNTRTSY